MRNFTIFWSGQLLSTIGSEMTAFAISIWVWELTHQATALSLIFFFSFTPRIVIASFAGIFVDRWNRQLLMIVGDTIVGLSTIAILLLLITNHLEIWHFYLLAAINGIFGYIQNLTGNASISMLVTKKNYARASAMNSVKFASAHVLAPALASILYYAIGFVGILGVDILTFIIAICTLLVVKIPSPDLQNLEDWIEQTILQKLTFGFKYIFQHASLLAILIYLLSFNLITNALFAIVPALILARSGDNTASLATIQTAFGFGGITSTIVLSIWGRWKRHIHGLLWGAILTQVSWMMLGLGWGLWVWSGAAFASAFFFTLLTSSNQAIWLSKIAPDIQGRVFASRSLIAQITTPLGLAIAGPLADYFFEPAMMPSGSLAGIFGGLFGTGPGAGMALQFTLFSLVGVVICLSGYAFRVLRDIDVLVPDHDVPANRNLST